MERVLYICTNCNYEFSRKIHIKFRYCPYCGKQNCVELKTGDFASKLINTV